MNPASSNGTSQAEPTRPGGELGKASNQPEKIKASKAPKGPSTMLPPPGKPGAKRNEKGGADRPPEKWAQPKAVAVGRGKASSAPSSDVEAEQEAMRQANVPSSFGAARDKPLGKRADREAHIVRGVPGAVISGASGRFATGRSGGRGGSNDKSGSGLEKSVDKEEARKQKEAEIAAITAELVRSEPDDAAEKGDGQEGGSGSVPSAQFKPGGWRHAGSGKMVGSVGPAGRKKSQRTETATGRSRREEEEEEEEPEEEEEQEEEEMTEEMRIKLVVRRLGLPVSHEVQLSGHRKGVTALALDRAGGRVATGSNDYKVRGCPLVPNPFYVGEGQAGLVGSRLEETPV